MRVLANLGKLKDGREVLFIDDSIQPFVVARNYNPAEREGQQWDNGIYFGSLDTLGSYVLGIERGITYNRMSEIADMTLHGMVEDDKDEAMYFIENEIELDESEMEYFGLTEDD